MSIRSYTLVLLSTVGLLSTGCSDDEDTKPQPIIDSAPSIQSVNYAGCGDGAVFCEFLVNAAFSADAGAWFYVLELEKGNEVKFRSTAERVSIAADQDVFPVFHVPYYDGLAPGTYNANLLKYGSWTDSEANRNRLSAENVSNTVTISAFSADCALQCCSNPEVQYKRWRAYAVKVTPSPNVLGVAGTFETWLNIDCCGATGTSNYTFSNVHATVGDGSGELWAQTGIETVRGPGVQYVSHRIYFEVSYGPNPSDRYIREDWTPGNHGSSGRLSVFLNPSTGTWYFGTYLGDTSAQFTNSAWINRKGTHIEFAGEILHPETDMMGEEGDTCWITNCEYLTDEHSYFVDAAINDDDPGTTVDSDDRGEWDIQLQNGGDKVLIWDKHPR